MHKIWHAQILHTQICVFKVRGRP